MLGTRPAALAPVLDELVASDLVHHEPPESRARLPLPARADPGGDLPGAAAGRAPRLHARGRGGARGRRRDRLPEVAAVLGRHYATAEDAERAVHYLELAGDHATDAFANDEAIASFSAALAVTRKDATMAAAAVRLHAKLANVLWRTGRRDEARAAFHAALELGGSGRRAPAGAPVHPAGPAGADRRPYEEAAAAFDAAEALLGDDPSDWDDATVDQWLELMVDGRADPTRCASSPICRWRLERARPLLEARARRPDGTSFYRQVTMQS